MICPLHRIQYIDYCSECNKQRIKVIECELDKKDRIYDTMKEQGYILDYCRSFVRLVFEELKK